MAPSVSPEHWGWTKNLERNRDSTFDIAMFRFVFQAAIEGARVLERNEALVSRWEACLVKLPDYPTTGDDERLGEIYVIAVDPDFHGKGLGGPMTRAGLDWLADRGLTTAMLYVESDNDAAIRTYERIGFARHATNRAYRSAR